MKKPRFVALALIVVLAVGALALFAYRTFAQDAALDDDGGTEAGNSDADSGAGLAEQAAITAEDAEEAVLAAYPGARVLESELEKEGGRVVYSVELDNGLEVSVDARDGTILSTATDLEDGD